MFAFTDRPIYRPAQTVSYKGIVRTREDADAPGGFVYHPYAGKPVTVEIRDSTDALISQQTIVTTANGSYAGQLPLAAEPVLGSYQLITKIGDRSYYSSFTVEAYRKPEYTVTLAFEKPHYVGGSTAIATLTAKYFSGEPLSNADVNYTVTGTGVLDQQVDADGVTDKNGQVCRWHFRLRGAHRTARFRSARPSPISARPARFRRIRPR